MSIDDFFDYINIFGDDKSGISNVFVVIMISIFTVIILVYMLAKGLKKSKQNYHSQEYWENRYSLFPKEMDWYCEFPKLSTDFKIEEILKERYPKKSKVKILELGCGNSTMSVDLVKIGYTNITSIDYSNVIIKRMKDKYQSYDIKCKNLFLNF